MKKVLLSSLTALTIALLFTANAGLNVVSAQSPADYGLRIEKVNRIY